VKPAASLRDPPGVLTGVQDEHDGGVVGEDDWRGLVFTLTP
jgi:hypothetical protein